MLTRKKYHILTFLGICIVFVILRQELFYDAEKTSHQNDDKRQATTVVRGLQHVNPKVEKHDIIDCKINNDVWKNIGLPIQRQSISCLADSSDSEVYVPFSFIRKYFDIYGHLSGSKSTRYLSWSHSYSKVFPHFKVNPYDPGGSFLQFSSFDVENRPRVKCISATENVPVTTQWDKRGYTYATQIAQYGLSHWSKMGSKGQKEKVTWVDDGQDSLNRAEWSGGIINRVSRDLCVHFDQPITLNVQNSALQGLPILMFDLLIREAPNIVVELHSPDYGTYKINYSPTATEDIFKAGKTITLRYMDKPIPEGQWKNFTRNLLNDLMKGISLDSPSNASGMLKKKTWLARKLVFSGVGCVSNIRFAASQHYKMFYHAADWLVNHQNEESGAWHVNVPFNAEKSKYPNAEEMAPGWISAMGSAQAMSVLTRAYRHSRNQRYLSAAIKALKPFTLSTNQGGVVAMFMNKYPWYEEYPTEPHSFVLNGFMYSLLGLYDLRQTLKEAEASIPDRESGHKLSDSLFNQGLSSLVAIAPLFDTGSGSTYDLRHFSMVGSGPPKLARWDYHSTHVNLMYVLSTVCSDSKDKSALLSLSTRWQRYMVGERADHN